MGGWLESASTWQNCSCQTGFLEVLLLDPYTCLAQGVPGQRKLLVVKPDGYLRLADSSSSFCRTYTLTASDTCGIGQRYNPNSEAVHAFFSLGKLIEARSLSVSTAACSHAAVPAAAGSFLWLAC